MTKGSDFWGSATAIPMEITATEPTPSSDMSAGREANEVYTNFGRTAWWRITATESTELSFNLLQSTYDSNSAWARIAVFQGNLSTGLTLVGRSDGNEYISGENPMPELLTNVTAGEVYFIQASVRDGYSDVTYVLQVGKVTYTETAWLDGQVYDYTPTAPNSKTYRPVWLAFNAGSGGAPTESSLTDYTKEPNPGTAIAAFSDAVPLQFSNQQVVGGIFPAASANSAPAGQKPNPDYNGINSPVLMDWTRYGGSAHSSLWGQRRLDDLIESGYYAYQATPPAGAISSTVDRNLPTVLQLLVKFQYTASVTNNDAPSSTGTTIVADAVTPPADDGSITENSTALKQDEWNVGGGGAHIFTIPGEDMGGNYATTPWIDMTPYMSEVGGYLVRVYVEDGGWVPIAGPGGNYYLAISGDFDPVDKIYTLQAPRTKYTVRTVGGTAELPEPVGRPDNVRRRFVG